MNHKRYPLAYLLEAAMPLNLVVTRDEEPEAEEYSNSIKADWLMSFDAGFNKVVTLRYYQQRKLPFEFKWKGFIWHLDNLSEGQRMIPVKSTNLWDAIQLLRKLDALADIKAMELN